MEIKIQNKAEDILQQVSSNFRQRITDAFDRVHPKQTMSDITLSEPTFVVGIGKNALVQVNELLRNFSDLIIGVRIHQIEGYTDATIEEYQESLAFLPHPLPSEQTFNFTEDTLNILKTLNDGTDVHFLISGGGSAAFAVPESEIGNKNYLKILELATASGFTIVELNLIRSLIDKAKGGKLLKYYPDLNFYATIFSDVVDDNPSVVASGPINPGIPKNSAIINWLERLFVSLDVSFSINKLVDKLPPANLENTNTTILATRMDLIQSIQSIFDNFQVVVADTRLDSSIEQSASQINQLINQFSKFSNRLLLYSGEPTITLTSHAFETGKGGRISALSCLLAEKIKDQDNLVFIGLATDGKDGSSPLSGYVIDHATYDELSEFGDIQSIISQGDSGLALSGINRGIILENPDINLLDLYMVFIL